MWNEYLILLPCLVIYVFSSSTNDYGSFNLIMKKFEPCKGPKRKDCCVASAEIINGSTVIYDLLVKENMTPNKNQLGLLDVAVRLEPSHERSVCAPARTLDSTRCILNLNSLGKILAMSKGKEFLRLQMKKPCDHLFLMPLLQTMLNVTKSCVIRKGHYNFKVNIQEIAEKYYGGTFLFGNWTFKAVFYSEECNMSCSMVEVELSPKNKTLEHHKQLN